MSMFKGTCHTCNKNCCDYDKLLKYFRDRNMDSTQSNFKRKKFHRRRVNVDMSTRYAMDKDTHPPYSKPNYDDTDEYKVTEPLSDLEMEIENIDANSDFEFDINFDDFKLEFPSITDEFEISGEDETLYQHVLISTPNKSPRGQTDLIYPRDEYKEMSNRSSDDSINDPVHDDSMEDVSLSYHEQNNMNQRVNKNIKDQVTDSWCKWLKPSQAESESDDDESEGSGQERNGNRNRRRNKKVSVWRKLFWLFID